MNTKYPQYNKTMKYLIKYNELNDLRSIAEDNDDIKEFKALDKKCNAAWDSFLDNLYTLPKYQQAIVKSSRLY
jgi:hypothetical protein